MESAKVIEFIKNNISPLCVATYVAGSMPQNVQAQSDLDFYCVIDGNKKQEFFEKTNKIMKKYIKNNPILTYTFIRGPIKYKTKGLIHFLVSTTNIPYQEDNKELFLNEHKVILRYLLAKTIVLSGKSPKELLNGKDLQEEGNTLAKRNNEKYKLLKEKGIMMYNEWKKTKNGWNLVKINIKANKFLKSYLISYFEKWK